MPRNAKRPDPWDLRTRRNEITVPPANAYRKLAENCISEAEQSSLSLSRSLIKLADLYTRTADAIEAQMARGVDGVPADRTARSVTAAQPQVNAPA